MSQMITAASVILICVAVILVLALLAPYLTDLDPIDREVIKQVEERNRQNARAETKPDAVD